MALNTYSAGNVMFDHHFTYNIKQESYCEYVTPIPPSRCYGRLGLGRWVIALCTSYVGGSMAVALTLLSLLHQKPATKPYRH